MSMISTPSGLQAVRNLKLQNGKILLIEKSSSASATPDTPPCHTLVKILLKPAVCSNIFVEIHLPEPQHWNGRFLGLGNGGAAGSINPAIFTKPLHDGYAAASTDLGTSPNPDSGIGNREVWKDFGFRATHLMTLAAKEVIRAFYGREPAFSYFSGSSTGGQQALQEAQRYPEDYDGILAQLPAHCRTPLHAYFLWNFQILQKCPFSAEQEANVIAAGNEYMAPREIPTIAGKFISDPRCTPADIEAVVALAMKKDASLTPEHAKALRLLFGGPVHAATGERIFDGLPFGSTFDIARGNLYLFRWVFGKERDLMTINFAGDIDTYTAELGPWLNAENPDLSRFEQHGGKLIITSGSADSCVPYHATLDYYEQAAEKAGSLEHLRKFCLFYLIPGMSHGPGPGINQLPDLLNLLTRWRENAEFPGTLSGERVEEGSPHLQLPIPPYPEKNGPALKIISGPRGGVSRIAARFLPPAEA